jgi:hypothetical protein
VERGKMRLSVFTISVLLVVGLVLGDDAESDSLVRMTVNDFMLALQSGDGADAAAMFSVQAMDQVDLMLVTVKQNLDRDPETTIGHLTDVGYSVELEAVEDWEAEEYLAATLSLPMMSARYMPYEIEIFAVTLDGRNAVVDMVFRTAVGVEIPQQAVLSYDDDVWKVTSFMGITAFP